MPTNKLFAVAVFILFAACNTKKSSSVSTEKNVPPAINTIVPAVAKQLTDLSNYTNAFVQSVTQRFTVAAAKPQIIVAKKGLRVNVIPGNLQADDGSAVTAPITVSIIELTTADELFRSNAATMSNGQLLESGGSYFIGMESDGKKLQLKKGKIIQVDFPQIKNGEMELFYGERNDDGDMNWVRAGATLQPAPQDEISFSDNNFTYDAAPAVPFMKGKEYVVYPTLQSKVYLYNTEMTIKDLIDTINKKEKRIYVDTVYMWPKEIRSLTGVRVDSNFLRSIYGPDKQFMLKTVKAKQQELEYAKQRKEMMEQAIDKWQPQSIAGQLQKYYSTSPLTSLGWINCDRFYNNPPNEDVPVELPYTFTKGSIQYFIIYKSFNGLMSGKINFADSAKISLGKLPVGEPVTLIAFTKKEGEIFQCKENFVVTKNKIVKPVFETITAEELAKIFGKNVKT